MEKVKIYPINGMVNLVSMGKDYAAVSPSENAGDSFLSFDRNAAWKLIAALHVWLRETESLDS